MRRILVTLFRNVDISQKHIYKKNCSFSLVEIRGWIIRDECRYYLNNFMSQINNVVERKTRSENVINHYHKSRTLHLVLLHCH